MKNVVTGLLLASALIAANGIVHAKLPPPTEEEKSAAEAKKQTAAEQAQQAKQALEKAQDRTVQHYRQSKGQRANQANKDAASAMNPSTEIPSAALDKRPLEKAEAYNEGVTPESARGATDGAKTEAAGGDERKVEK